MIDAYKTCWKKSFVMEGRASRSEYWYFILMNLLLVILFFVSIFFFSASHNQNFEISERDSIQSERLNDVEFYENSKPIRVNNDVSISDSLATIMGGLGMILFLASIPAMISAKVRRLHDIGYSGWWWFIGFVPFIGGIWSIVLAVFDSQIGQNRYGKNPWGVGNGEGMFCANCGKKVEQSMEGSAGFCTQCGQAVPQEKNKEEKKEEKWV